MRALDELKGVLEHRDALRAQLERLGAEIAARRKELEREQRQSEQARAARVEAEGELARARAALDGIGFDARQSERLDAAREPALALAQQRQLMARAGAEASDAKSKAARLAERARDEQREVAAAQEAHEQAAQLHARSAEGLRAAERAEAAQVLRETLHAGAECPVCEQTVARAPAPLLAPALIEKRRAHGEAAGARTGARPGGG
jgi:exonuclease SbcC